MTIDVILFALIILLEASRWVYDVWWQRREERDLMEQTKLLEDILVSLSIKEKE